MKNLILIGIFILGLGLGNSFSQEKVIIRTIVTNIETVDSLIIDYYTIISGLDKSNSENINIAFEYFKEIFGDRRELQRDTAALIFQNYYLKHKGIYLNEKGESVSCFDINKDEILTINEKLSKSGLVLSFISEGEEFYLEALPGFLPNQFKGYISENLLEFFLLYDIYSESSFVRFTSKDITKYIKLIEQLLIKIESYSRNLQLPLKKDYINRFYISQLINYLTISDNFGIKLNETISDSDLTLKNVYSGFAECNSNTLSGKLVFFYNKKLSEELQDQLKLDEFFYCYDYNEFSIPEIRKDLTIENVLLELKKYLNKE